MPVEVFFLTNFNYSKVCWWENFSDYIFVQQNFTNIWMQNYNPQCSGFYIERDSKLFEAVIVFRRKITIRTWITDSCWFNHAFWIYAASALRIVWKKKTQEYKKFYSEHCAYFEITIIFDHTWSVKTLEKLWTKSSIKSTISQKLRVTQKKITVRSMNFFPVNLATFELYFL